MTIVPPFADCTEICVSLRALAPAGVGIACGLVRDETAALFPEERAAIAKAVAKRRNEFSSGRILARKALKQIDQLAAALPPDVSRRPRWPEGVVGSITHSNGLCAAVVAPISRVLTLGLDLEQVLDVQPSLLPSIAQADEIEDLAMHVPNDLIPALIFSAKEAAFKAYHPITNHFLGFRDVRLTVSGDAFAAKIVTPDCPSIFGHTKIEGRFALVGGMILSLVAVPPAVVMLGR